MIITKKDLFTYIIFIVITVIGISIIESKKHQNPSEMGCNSIVRQLNNL